MQITLTFPVLEAIFSMSSDSLQITRRTLSRRLGLGQAELDRQLLVLDRRGFIDAARLRLTLPGLALAVSLRSAAAHKVAHAA